MEKLDIKSYICKGCNCTAQLNQRGKCQHCEPIEHPIFEAKYPFPRAGFAVVAIIFGAGVFLITLFT